jgi:hypothetical protein
MTSIGDGIVMIISDGALSRWRHAGATMNAATPSQLHLAERADGFRWTLNPILPTNSMW